MELSGLECGRGGREFRVSGEMAVDTGKNHECGEGALLGPNNCATWTKLGERKEDIIPVSLSRKR